MSRVDYCRLKQKCIQVNRKSSCKTSTSSDRSSSEEPKRKYLRAYDSVFLKYGFTYCVKNGEHQPLCVLCNEILANENLKPLKLQRHLETKHANYKDKDLIFF